MQVFLAHSFSENGEILLSAEESKHCIRVLRHKAGDVINVIDGVGNFYTAEIVDANAQKCVARIQRQEHIGSRKPYRLHIAISPTKNADRIEWLVEKGTELGVDEFSFVICKRTEKTGVKTERFRKIAESAVKQSVQGTLPKINEKILFKDFIQEGVSGGSQRFIAHCMEAQKVELKRILQERKVLVLIGPEGDFADEEVALAQINGFMPLSLGEARLRTETAGLLVASAFHTSF
jgi:16S rRNA (uracil1498-N3)-methyltransferase